MQQTRVIHFIGKSALIAFIGGLCIACLGQSKDQESETLFRSDKFKVELSYGNKWKRVEANGEGILIMLELSSIVDGTARCNLNATKNATEFRDPAFWMEEFKKPGVAKYVGDNIPGTKGKSTFVGHRESTLGGVPANEIEFKATGQGRSGRNNVEGLMTQTVRGEWVYYTFCVSAEGDLDRRRDDFSEFVKNVKFVDSD